MKTNPITLPPELRRLWAQQAQSVDPRDLIGWQEHVATQAARWGADQQRKLDAEQINKAWQKGADMELEACCQALYARYEIPKLHIYDGKDMREWLRTARRPQPPSLKEQAFAVLDDCSDRLDSAHENVLRRALEALDALCAELVDELEDWIAYGDALAIEKAHNLVDRARTLLAQPVAEGPTDEEPSSPSGGANDQ